MVRRFGYKLAFLAAAWLAVPTCSAADTEIAAQFHALLAEYAARLESLAKECEAQGLAKEADQTRRWLVPRDGRVFVFHLLPQEAGFDSPPEGMAAAVRTWHEKFCQLRRDRAEVFFELAKSAVKANRTVLAFQILNQAARENPDHAAIRAILGYERDGNAWRTPYEIAKHKAGMTWHPQFGWLLAEHVARYEKGERLYKNSWISAERDAELHRNIDTPWKIETEHYLISTNHSLEAGVQLGQRLERLHEVWRQLFASYVVLPSQLQRAFETPAPAVPLKKRHTVVCFRNKDEYRRALVGDIPNIGMTTGLYLSSRSTAYFYADEQDVTSVYHEGAHQLFGESRTTIRDVGQRAHFWLIEGLACYMESLTEHAGYITLGGLDAIRIQDCRYYAHKQDFSVPLSELVRMNMHKFQTDPQIKKLYAHSASLVDFLLHGQGGEYADAFVGHAQAVYLGRDRALPAATGQSYAQLDEQYARWLQLDDAQLRVLPQSRTLTYLVLGGTRVTDAGLKTLPELPALGWIDLHKTTITDEGLAALGRFPTLQQVELSATGITDEGCRHLAGLRNLHTVLLGGTGITDAGLAAISRLPRLTRLELWNTRVTGAGLQALAAARTLQSLDISGCAIGDDDLKHLQPLANLESLDLRRTKVTARGKEALKKILPKVKLQEE